MNKSNDRIALLDNGNGTEIGNYRSLEEHGSRKEQTDNDAISVENVITGESNESKDSETQSMTSGSRKELTDNDAISVENVITGASNESKDSETQSMTSGNKRTVASSCCFWSSCCGKGTVAGFVSLILLGVIVINIGIIWTSEKSSKKLPDWVFIVSISLNSVTCIFVLIDLFIFICQKKESEIIQEIGTFPKLKIISFYSFGGCNLLYNWFYVRTENEGTLSMVMNIISMFFVFILCIHCYSFHKKQDMKTGCKPILLLLIYFANIVNFLIPLFHYTYLSQCSEIVNSTTENKTDFSQSNLKVLQTADPFLLSGMMGFCLLIFYFECSRIYKNKFDINLITQSCATRSSKYAIMRSCCQHLCLLVSFGLIGFVVTEDLVSELLETDFVIFIIIQIIIKSILSVLLICIIVWFLCSQNTCASFCLAIKFLCKRFCSDLWLFLIITTLLGNIIYNCILIVKCCVTQNISKENKIAVIINGVISIITALLQTIVILSTYVMNTCKHHDNQGSIEINTSEHDHNATAEQPLQGFIRSLFSILGIINFGLWISDSIGTDWMNKVLFCEYFYNDVVLLYFTNLVLYLTIFFYFQASLEFFVTYLERKI